MHQATIISGYAIYLHITQIDLELTNSLPPQIKASHVPFQTILYPDIPQITNKGAMSVYVPDINLCQGTHNHSQI